MYVSINGVEPFGTALISWTKPLPVDTTTEHKELPLQRPKYGLLLIRSVDSK
jgi:hypothetical protein